MEGSPCFPTTSSLWRSSVFQEATHLDDTVAGLLIPHPCSHAQGATAGPAAPLRASPVETLNGFSLALLSDVFLFPSGESVSPEKAPRGLG